MVAPTMTNAARVRRRSVVVKDERPAHAAGRVGAHRPGVGGRGRGHGVEPGWPATPGVDWTAQCRPSHKAREQTRRRMGYLSGTAPWGTIAPGQTIVTAFELPAR